MGINHPDACNNVQKSIYYLIFILISVHSTLYLRANHYFQYLHRYSLSSKGAGDHVTFVYDNIVSQQIVFAIFQNSINLYRSCSRKPNSYSSSIKLSNIALVFSYLCLHKLVTYFLTNNTTFKSLCKHN